MDRTFGSVFWMILAMLCVSLATFLAALLGAHFPLDLLLFMRFFVPLVLFFWLYLVTNRIPNIAYMKHHALRALSTVLGQYCLFYFLFKQNMTTATLMYCTTSFFMPFLSMLFYGKRITIAELIFIVLGFYGVMLVLHPSGHYFSWLMLIGLGSGFFNGCTQVITHRISSQQDPFDATFLVYVMCSFWSLIPVLFLWHTHEWGYVAMFFDKSSVLLIMIGFAVCGISNFTFRTKAYHFSADSSKLAPLLYLPIIFSAWLDHMYFHKTFGIQDFIGMFIVVLSGVGIQLWHHYRASLVKS